MALSLILYPLSGCSVGDFIGSYFNTYYNAQRLFNEAEDEILNPRTGKPPDQSSLTQFSIQPASKTKFTSVIEKCSKLLQYHPQSSLVEGSLLMIGKSYYYQNEYQKAERKFSELLQGYPESSYKLEANLLLARTYYRMNDKAKAVSVATELADQALSEGKNDVAAEVSLLLGGIFLENKDLEAAVKQYQKSAEHGDTPEQRTRSYLTIGEIRAQEGDFEKALIAYRQAEDESSGYENEYKAVLGQARALSNLGRHESSLAILEELIDNTNFKEFFGEIDLEIGNVYAAMNDLHSAVARYTYVDTTYARTEYSANSYYQLGMLYEDRLFLYDSARIAYNKGRNEAPAAPITLLLFTRAEYMNKYHTYKSEIARNDTIRELILNPPDSLLSNSDSTAVAWDSISTDSLTVLHQERPDTVKPKRPSIPNIPIDTVEARLAYNKTELASLFFGTIGRIDSAKEWYSLVLAQHPKSPFVARAMFALAQINSQDSTYNKDLVDSMYRDIVRRFPESEFAAESKKRLGIQPTVKPPDKAQEVYGKAERLMNQGKSLAAIDTFATIVKKYPDSPLASKAQYSVGWLYEQISRPDSALQNYVRLVTLYPTSEYAALVKSKLAEVERFRESHMQGDSTHSDSTGGPPKGNLENQGGPKPIKPKPEGEEDLKHPDGGPPVPKEVEK